MDIGNSSKTTMVGENAVKKSRVKKATDVRAKNSETKEENPEHLGKNEYKMDMDNVLSKVEMPFKKIKENLYLVSMTTKAEIEKFVAKIQMLTKVSWSVKQTRKFDYIKKKPLTLFKRTYGCHMATRTRARTKKQRNKKSRNIDCPAQLLVTVRQYISYTRAKVRGQFMDKKYPCAVEFRNHHNHRIDTADVLNTRPLGEKIKEDILKLLNKGHSCASAYHTLYTIKVDEFGAEYKTKMTDRHNFPKKNDIATLWKLHNFKEKSEHNADFAYTIKNLEEILDSYQKKNGTIYKMIIINHMIVICICTPLMQRTIQQISEIIFIESSGDDIKEYKMYFILTQASVGALPIGSILTNSNTMAAFIEGMKLWLQMVHIQPTVVLTNTEIMKALIVQKCFPNSKILYSFYHILSSAWKVLHETRHEIVRAKKESYYQLFREVVFADSEEGLVVARQVLAVECANQKFLDYVDKMYEHISLWCLLYKQYIVLRGIETFNYNEAETSFRLFRFISKIALERTKLLNLTQMTDYMCSAFEKYYKNRVMEMVLNKESKVLQEKYSRTSNGLLQMEDIGHHQYLFKKATQDILDEYYQVDMVTNLCTCAMGIMGKQCEHISEVLSRCNILTQVLTIEQKAAYYFVASGVLKHNNSFLPEQEQDLMEYRMCCSPETILGSECDAQNVQSSDVKATQSLENTKKKWMTYCNKIISLVEKDPVRFLPAVNAHMENVQKYSTSVSMLLKGLYAGFPYKGDADSLPPLTIISNKTVGGGKNSESQLSLPNTSYNPPPLVTIKQESSETLEMRKNKEAPPLTKMVKRYKLKQSNTAKKKKGSFVPKCDSPDDNYSSKSNSPLPIDNVHNSDEELKGKITILDEKMGILVEKYAEVHRDSASFEDKLAENQVSNNDGEILNNQNFLDGNGQIEDVAGGGSTIFDIQKGIYVDQNTLSELSDCEIAMLDEKKEILIIRMSQQ